MPGTIACHHSSVGALFADYLSFLVRVGFDHLLFRFLVIFLFLFVAARSLQLLHFIYSRCVLFHLQFVRRTTEAKYKINGHDISLVISLSSFGDAVGCFLCAQIFFRCAFFSSSSFNLRSRYLLIDNYTTSCSAEIRSVCVSDVCVPSTNHSHPRTPHFMIIICVLVFLFNHFHFI